MSGSERDRRIAERDAANHRYNKALTSVDGALPRLPDEPRPGSSSGASSGGAALREGVAILAAMPPAPAGWRGRLAGFVWRLVAPVLERQQSFNARVSDEVDRLETARRDAIRALNAATTAWQEHLEAFSAFDSRLVQFLQQITPFIDTKIRLVEHSLEELHMAAASAQRSAIAARRELERLGAAGRIAEPPSDAARTMALTGGAGDASYVGFEDLFRGTSDEIRERQRDYAEVFAGASDVIDVGCGRGELIELLGQRGVTARGIDTNAAMVEECRARGLDVRHGDALAYLTSLADESLGGLIAIQVVEHLPPEYLVRLIAIAHAKLRPGALIVLETINAACWVAFFESYVRDITHVRPLHPDTLKFLVVAAGFERVDVHFRSPVAEDGRLQRVDTAGLSGPLAEVAHVVNRNAERLNERLFTYLDYAVIGAKAR